MDNPFDDGHGSFYALVNSDGRTDLRPLSLIKETIEAGVAAGVEAS
jgi:hypothetical protein